MPKSPAPFTTRRKPGRAATDDLPNALEGQIAEICRDLAVQTKRMRQLQEQADELRSMIGEWAGGVAAGSPPDSAGRGRRR
jgi:hypothetical protein